MKYRNIKQGIIERLLAGSMLAVPLGLCVAQAIEGSRDARERVAYTTYEPGPTVGDNVKYGWGINHDISGFDRNNDGAIDEIKVQCLSVLGKGMPLIYSRRYNFQNEEFSELKEILGREK